MGVSYNLSYESINFYITEIAKNIKIGFYFCRPKEYCELYKNIWTNKIFLARRILQSFAWVS